MENTFTTISALIREADKALSTLEKNQQPQIEAKGDTILEQVCDYIYQKLDAANWIFDGAKYWDDIEINTCGVLYLGNAYFAMRMMNPVAQITKNGIKMLNKPKEHEMLTLVHNWENFKPEIDKSIENALKKKQIEIDKRLSHLTYVQNELDGFKI